MAYGLAPVNLATRRNRLRPAVGIARMLGDRPRWVQNPGFAPGFQMAAAIAGPSAIVLVGSQPSNAGIFSSADGQVFTARANTLAFSPTCGAYSPTLGLFCTAGNVATALGTSPDGTTWTPRTGVNNGAMFAMCWGNGIFVTGGSTIAGTLSVQTSANGTAWTLRTVSAGMGANTFVSALVWSPELGLFIATVADTLAATGARIFSSPDGTTWTRRDTAAQAFPSMYAVAYSPKQRMFVALGTSQVTAGVMTSSPFVAFSRDGRTWYPGYIPPFFTLGALSGLYLVPDIVVWDGNRFVACGHMDGSSVGTTWTISSSNGMQWRWEPSLMLDLSPNDDRSITGIAIYNGLLYGTGSGNFGTPGFVTTRTPTNI